MARNSVLWWIVLAVPTLSLALFMQDRYYLSLLNLVAISALIAASLRFVMLIGELNFATSASVGLGAYGAGAATTIYDLPFPVAVLTGAVVATLVSVVFGAITLRTRGPYFMLTGFAFAEVVRLLFRKADWLGGVSGMIGIFPPRAMDDWMPLVVVGVVLVLLIGLYRIEKSDFGLILNGIRDHEEVVRTVGINVFAYKLACFAIASLCAGFAGSLHAFENSVISPADFSFLLAVFALAYVKIGGESSIAGPIVGSVILVLLGSFALGLGTGEHVFYGGAIIFAMLLLKDGVIGLFDKVFRPGVARRHREQMQAETEEVA